MRTTVKAAHRGRACCGARLCWRPEDDGFSNHVQADDLARLMSLALWRGRPQRIYYASDDTEMRMGEYFEWAARLYGLPPPPRISREQARQQLPASLLELHGRIAALAQ